MPTFKCQADFFFFSFDLVGGMKKLKQEVS